jgi:hypothetical protein
LIWLVRSDQKMRRATICTCLGIVQIISLVAESTHGFVGLSLYFEVQIVLIYSVDNLDSVDCRYAKKDPSENIKYVHLYIDIKWKIHIL